MPARDASLHDQDDTDLLLVGNVAQPRHGHVTEYERQSSTRYARGRWFALTVARLVLIALGLCVGAVLGLLTWWMWTGVQS